MRIMTILGSPRDNGNTAKVLRWIEEHIHAQGHEIAHIHIVDYNIQGCRECWICKRQAFELCNIEDDIHILYDHMIEADVILLATPLFAWGFTSQLKPLIDRMYCLVEDHRDNPYYASQIEGKPLALLVTAGGPEENNADLLIKGFHNMTAFLKSENKGHLLIPFCKEPDDLGEMEKSAAVTFAEKLIS